MLTPAKQVQKLLDGVVRVVNFAAVGLDDVVTTALTTALSTASSTGGVMPLQVASASVFGVVTTAAKNKVAIFDTATKLPISSGGNEVFGRLTEAAGVYTVTYFTLVAGVETAYNMPATNIDFEFFYRFDFERLPADFATGVSARVVSDDPTGGSIPVEELRTVTALNTLQALSFAPAPANSLVLVVNHLEYSPLDGAFTVTGTAVTWIPGVAGFNLETTDKVVAKYRR
jgi:hypothetical protein